MCGIAGIRRYGTDPITIDHCNLMLCELESRGADATGLAFQFEDGSVEIYKTPKSAWVACKDKEFGQTLTDALDHNPLTVLLHTRFGCTNPLVNENNHPLYKGKAAIIHNGGIDNHKELFNALKLERSADTDSDIIRAIVDDEGITPAAIRTLNRMSGSCAAACIHPEYPGKLLLLRSGSPLEAAKVGTNLFFASTQQAIYLGSRPYQQWNGFWAQGAKSPLQWLILPKDSAWILGDKGLEFHDKFNTCAQYFRPDYTKVRTNYASRKEQFENDAKWKNRTTTCTSPTTPFVATGKGKKGTKYFRCPNDKCNAELMLPAKYRDTPLHKLNCPTCHTPIAKKGN